MTYARSQKGMSLLSWLVVLAFVAFIASAAFKVIPHYLDYYAVEKAIKAVETDKSAEVSDVHSFYAYMERALMLNGIRDLKLDEALDIKQENNEFLAHLKYEKREPLVQNIDLVVKFDKEFRVRVP
ncbi:MULTISPECIES: DUF4845 domain-containing protein [Pseudomonas]|uniref:DUF4845 domain-containing protein n=1 Tax=Pseudomonas nitroreducens TaxID=46680 RepID=A0A6G6IT93_PSENT|nr:MULTISPECIES: DUF4845 domain-containing protein [Pseudomonas]MBG6291121.1 DUF4845 domain-containing protein [Pseudomonas nitroreducens]NMZ61592.1 DUF4845 domain-containing protein [Pseudomonas nitroreducens]OBY60418.1 DUF4845 domain-containing protein [Pseudomonas sp. AU12215]QIE86214.1 DUF4845 domain-containing protein [Pseudomonas nitroreducens]UCL88469.1 DUF4845 domain-containing protein [Pseudomonas sp. HS-18]